MKTNYHDFNSGWRFIELPNMMDDYVDLGQRLPHIRISEE